MAPVKTPCIHSMRRWPAVRYLAIATVLCALTPADPALADRTIRCQGRLVSIGAFKEQVEEKCGTPDYFEEWEEGRNSAISQIYDYEKERYIRPHLILGPIRMERWTYNFGSNRLIHYLYFQNGKLTKIETGETGSD